MSIRCGCFNEGDATVFGEIHECSKDPSLRYRKEPRRVQNPGVYPIGEPVGPLVPSWAFVVPAETPAEIVLDDDERGGH